MKRATYSATIFRGTITVVILIISLMPSQASGQMPSSWETYLYNQSEFVKYLNALPSVNMEFNPYNTSSRVGRIYRELVSFSGKEFALFPAQTGTIGQAHNGGIIIIDISKLSEPDEILAFWLAHEWGHQDLGHATNIYKPYQSNSWQIRELPTEKEDSADRYAAKFLRHEGYSIDRVLAHLESLPTSPYDHSHSPGWQRARIVSNAYRGDSNRKKIPCQHQVACQHLVACTHAAHSFDTYHPYDVNFYGVAVQCTHRIPCQHPLHQYGDAAHPYDTLHEFDYN